MKTIKVISSAIAMLICCMCIAQEQSTKTAGTLLAITGVVTDNSGLPLPGVTVAVKGKKARTTTNFDGKYAIRAVKGSVLQFSFMGYRTAQVKVQGTNVINMQLQDDQEVLSEVVINTGNKSVTKQKSAAVVSSVSVQAVEDRANASVARNLKGQVSGLNVTAGSGQPGTDSTIILRGVGSIADKSLPHTSYGTIVNNESYEGTAENPFESPHLAPLSTFSIDTDNASYTNIRRMINNGQEVPPDAVRIEEMVNFFKYSYPQPADGQPFSINSELAECAWNSKHRLLKIGLQGRNIPTDNLPASNLVFLIDVSGSMNQENKLPLLVESLKILVKELRSKDKVGIVVYAGAAGTVLEPTSGDEKETIYKALAGLSAGGSTAGGAGIRLAYKLAGKHFIKGGNNRVILATDGDFNVGTSSDKDMKDLIEEKRQSGVFLTCLGFGMGNYKDSKMEILANKGNGNYAYIDNIQEAKRFLGKEFKGSMYAIAKDVKFQVEFNPAHVQAYRLIGYENRRLHAEDFVNDKIDAGELGSGHTVTALYEIIPVGVNSEFYKDAAELKYTKTEKTSGKYSDELATIKLRYKKPDGDTSTEIAVNIANTVSADTTEDFRFCSSVAWFGLKLRNSELAKNKSAADITRLAKAGLKNDAEGYRAEFVRLMEAGR